MPGVAPLGGGFAAGRETARRRHWLLHDHLPQARKSHVDLLLQCCSISFKSFRSGPALSHSITSLRPSLWEAKRVLHGGYGAALSPTPAHSSLPIQQHLEHLPHMLLQHPPTMSSRIASRSFSAIRALPPAAPALRFSRRSFFSLPGTPESQHLSATRTLPHPLAAVYDIIVDVDSYSSFVPFCARSRVLQWSDPDAQGRRWPALADLHVGWGGFNEAFTSRVCCEPGVSVEARSGDSDGTGKASTVFKSLVTRWSVRPASPHPHASPSTEVHLDIKFQFVSPVYAAVSATVSDKVASAMIEAFEEHARQRLGR